MTRGLLPDAGVNGGGNWTARLAQALERVDEAQGHELRSTLDRWADAGAFDDDQAIVFGIYRTLCYEEGTRGPQYEPLGAALREAVTILGEHPVLAPFGPDAGMHELPKGTPPAAIRMFALDYETSGPLVVAGLLCRARQVGGNRFETAAAELLALLDGADDGFGSLSAGYRVSVFYGLRVGEHEEIEINGNLKLVPLARTEAFLDMSLLRTVTRQDMWGMDWSGASAIVETVPWRPAAVGRRDGRQQGADDAERFYHGQRDLIALLSVCHGAPIAEMGVFSNHVHRTAPLLLGIPFLAGASAMLHPEGIPSADIRQPKDLDAEAFETARRLYSNRERCGDYRIAISRLSRALMRIGDYSVDDSILDAAIALERMYEPGRGEITYKLKMRAACFLASDMQARKDVLEKVNRFYGARSAIVHGGRKEMPPEKLKEAFEAGFDVARRTLVELLGTGPPGDWNEIVLAGQGGAGPPDSR
ncbi:MAG: HEPN domain-containing protein [Alphaproteobacteria bacterium]|nr:HEPN domain-containing protein [Alphaproteobacteria bacterium]